MQERGPLAAGARAASSETPGWWPEELAHAGPEHLDAGTIRAVRAGFLTYQHRGEPADAVFTRNALHHLPDFWKAIALRRVARWLRPRGVLRLRDLVYSFEHSTFTWLLEPMLERAGFEIRDRWLSPTQTDAAYTCLLRDA